MPPKPFSRYFFCKGLKDSSGNVYLSERVPFRYQDLRDNRYHQVAKGDTLHSLAERYFEGIDDAADLWWVIADYQPEPIHDPTLLLTPGMTLVIPSVRLLTEEIFNESRREV